MARMLSAFLRGEIQPNCMQKIDSVASNIDVNEQASWGKAADLL